MLLGCAKKRKVMVSGKKNVQENTKMGFYECVFLLQTLSTLPPRIRDPDAACGELEVSNLHYWGGL